MVTAVRSSPPWTKVRTSQALLHTRHTANTAASRTVLWRWLPCAGQSSAVRSGQHRLSGQGGAGTHRLQKADVLPKGSDAAAEGEKEHQHAHHDQQDGGVHCQTRQGCFWERSSPQLEPRAHPEEWKEGAPNLFSPSWGLPRLTGSTGLQEPSVPGGTRNTLDSRLRSGGLCCSRQG